MVTRYRSPKSNGGERSCVSEFYCWKQTDLSFWILLWLFDCHLKAQLPKFSLRSSSPINSLGKIDQESVIKVIDYLAHFRLFIQQNQR
ncbi:hypothetical protein SAMN05443247_05721 [Bradyrhizobium erythrophlei]|nr:hypothetical protein SAMN05443247_05721 [Bradyrhizobium erythrophlei]